MGDPFYVNRGEIKHNLARLRTNIQRLESQSHPSSSPSFSRETELNDAVFDKTLITEILALVNELEYQLKDLTETYGIQTTKFKQLGLSPQEMANRKEIVEGHQKEFDDLKDRFANQVRADPSSNADTVISGFYGKRETSQRRYQIEKENRGYAGSLSDKRDSLPLDQPNRISMHAMKQQFADEEDDVDLVEIITRKAKENEAGTTRVHSNRRYGTVGGMLERHFPLSNRRNRIIFYVTPIVIIVIILIIVLAVSLKK